MPEFFLGLVLGLILFATIEITYTDPSERTELFWQGYCSADHEAKRMDYFECIAIHSH